jgi:hypothetical protein
LGRYSVQQKLLRQKGVAAIGTGGDTLTHIQSKNTKLVAVRRRNTRPKRHGFFNVLTTMMNDDSATKVA